MLGQDLLVAGYPREEYTFESVRPLPISLCVIVTVKSDR